MQYIYEWLEMYNMGVFFDKINHIYRYIMEELDLDYFVDKLIKHDDIPLALAVDAELHGQRAHAGVKTNKNYGVLIFRKYRNRYHETGLKGF